MRLWRTSRHAPGLHSLPTWHRGQSRESLGHCENGADPRRQGVQKVTGCLAALSRFISRLGERALPLYRLLKKADHFSWTPEAQALDNLKRTLTTAPVLVPPQPTEPLLLYVAVMTQVVSAAVVVERPEEGHALPVQRPVYFISEVLSETKVRYPQIQKLIYAVIRTRRNLQHYFLGHPITVVSSFPLGEIIQSREATGRIAKWSVEVMSETLTYAPHMAIKVSRSGGFRCGVDRLLAPPAQVQAELWMMYFDGSLMKTGAGAGLLFISPLSVHMRYVIKIHFTTSNNIAEYEALVNGLKIAIELGVRRLELVHIARRYNEAVDQLAKVASTRGTIPPDAFSRDLHEPSIDLGSGAVVEASTPHPTDAIEALLMAAEVMEVEPRPG